MSRTPRTVADFDDALVELAGDTLPRTRWEHRYHEVDAVLRNADVAGEVPAHDVLRLRDALARVWRERHAEQTGT